MTPYVTEVISSETKELFARIEKAVSELPDLELGMDDKDEIIILSCHILARAVGGVFELPVYDGFFLNFFDHSWVESKDGEVIIDVYPVGILGGPILVDASGGLSPGRKMYFEKPERYGDSFLQPEFLKLVGIVKAEIEKIC